MSNGYALANSAESLQNISQQIESKTQYEYHKLKNLLKIGIQFNTQVTVKNSKHLVSQASCSAIPVAYSQFPAEYYEDFARMILNAAYETTFYAALLNYKNTGNNKLFLTLLGGGVFGNRQEWILDAVEKSVIKFASTPLDVKIVSFAKTNLSIENLLDYLRKKLFV